MIHLRSVEIDASAGLPDGFPFDLPFVRRFWRLEFKQPVTFLIGENGSGKSTFLEALACAADSIALGAQEVSLDPSLDAQRKLGDRMVVASRRKSQKGFFLRSEDFFNNALRLNRTWRELEAIEAEFESYLVGDALKRAQGPAQGQRRSLTERYGQDADARSHGESFLHIFRERFVPDGLYLLDEPETPLSPQRQLGLLSLLKEMVAQGGQFIIATHSPILMAFPEATILSFDHAPVKKVKYDETDQVGLTRAFLADPEAFLRRL
jgi:predicted ATPase